MQLIHTYVAEEKVTKLKKNASSTSTMLSKTTYDVRGFTSVMTKVSRVLQRSFNALREWGTALDKST